jgi:hypothetical protein
VPFLESHAQPVCTSIIYFAKSTGLSSQADGKRVSLPFLLDAAAPETVSEFVFFSGSSFVTQ